MMTNRCVLALRALLIPGLDGATPDLRRVRSDEEWSRANALDQEAYAGLEKRMIAFSELVDIWPDGACAYRRLGKTQATGYPHGPEEMKSSSKKGPGAGDGVPAKGEVVPLKWDEVGLPPPGTVSTPLVQHSRKGRGYFERLREDMLSGTDPNEILRDPDIKPYSDPALKDKRTMLLLATRMWVAGMLGWCTRCTCQISLFTVMKRVNPDGTWTTRPVWDLRLVNRLFQRAPWVSMASPASLGELDMSEPVVGNRVPASVQADVPDFFYCLETPESVWEFFCLPTIGAMELYRHLREQGIECVRPTAQQQFVALKVLAMGWSWAPFFAQCFLGEVIDCGEGPMADGALVGDRRALPCLLINLILAWVFIDDVSLLRLVDRDRAEEQLAPLAKWVRDQLASRGLGCHKELQGLGVEQSIGLKMTVDPVVLRPSPSRMAELMVATEWMLTLPLVDPNVARRILGVWTWCMLVMRPSYSVFHATYAWVAQHVDGPPVALWTTAWREFACAISLGPMMFSDLSIPFSTRVFESDASGAGEEEKLPNGGFGIVQTQSTLEEVREEINSGLEAYWVSQQDRIVERMEKGEDLDHEKTPGVRPIEEVVPSMPQKGRGFLEVGGNSEDLCLRVRQRCGVWTERWTAKRGRRYDLTLESARTRLRARLDRGVFFLVHFHVVASTFLTVKRLRTDRLNMGKENLKPDVLKAVHYDNQYVFWLAELVWVCLDLGVPVALSHPAHSILWKILPFRKLRDDGPGMIIFETDVCSLEGGCRRWRLLTNVPGLRGLGNLCTCPDRGPPSQDSSFALDKQAKEYGELVNSALIKGNLSLGIRLEVQRPPKAVSLRAGRNWEPLER